jgi:two-component system, OmpR family, sensor kinase
MAWKRNRLFWKLLLALGFAMGLGIAGTIAIVYFTGHPLPPDEARLGPLPLPFVPVFSGTLAILVTGVGLAWYLARPLRHLSWALRRIAEGRLDTRVQALMGGQRDEIADLAEDFDRMAARLQQLTESRETFLHDISHELRSPVTRMQAAIGLLRQDPAQVPAMIERLDRECERLDALVEELLTLHRLEAGRASIARGRVDIVELLHAIAEDADFEARVSSRSVTIDAPGTFVAEVDGELIYRAFENVIRNAVKFTAPGTVVETRSRVSDDGTKLETRVQDSGPGVPADMLEAIFEPFTRVEGSESVRGTGLGLAIARRTMTIHGGSIRAALREDGGLAITLELPAGTPLHQHG